jgi:hypothetical protein
VHKDLDAGGLLTLARAESMGSISYTKAWKGWGQCVEPHM